MNEEKFKNNSNERKVMGPKTEGIIDKKVQFNQSPISDIFYGQLSSKIHKTCGETSVNIQPFFTLQLNIDKANNISKALEGLTSRNRVEGLTSSNRKGTVKAWQQFKIEQLPVVLILHLKCFEYQVNGCTKIMKTIKYPIDLNIDSNILSGRTHSISEKQYSLFAVVYHVGKEASYGHYIADALHERKWFRFDDSKIESVSEDSVLSPRGNAVPYLLFYKRSDTV